MEPALRDRAYANVALPIACNQTISQPLVVARMLELLEEEVRICLGLLGVTSYAELTPRHVTAAPAVRMPDTFSAFPLPGGE